MFVERVVHAPPFLRDLPPPCVKNASPFQLLRPMSAVDAFYIRQVVVVGQTKDPTVGLQENVVEHAALALFGATQAMQFGLQVVGDNHVVVSSSRETAMSTLSGDSAGVFAASRALCCWRG